MSSLRAYIITRFLLAIPMVLILLTIVFILLRVMPGDPIRAALRPGVPQEYLDQLRHAQGLDRPLVFNLRGSWAEASEAMIVLYSQHDPASPLVGLAVQGDRLPITDRWTEGDQDWLRLSLEAGEPVWVEVEKLAWLRQVEFQYTIIDEGPAPDGTSGSWVRVTLVRGGVEGWAPASSFDITVNPLDSQFFNYLWGLLTRFDLGSSVTLRGRPVALDLGEKFPATAELSVAGMLVASLVGIFTGAFAAQKRRSAADYGLRLYSIVAYAIPIFWLGLMFQLIFAILLGWFPVAGRVDTGYRPDTLAQVFGFQAHLSGPVGEKVLAFTNFLSNFYVFASLITGQWSSLFNALYHLVLPSMTLGLYLSGVFTRLTRANMLDVLQQDFVTAARARGIPEKIVIYKHALLNAFVPILTMFGLQFALLLAGAVLTETTFNWPGMGLFLVDRIVDRDFPAIQGTVVFFALLVATVSLVVDVLHARIDPRVRY
ncbi:MAG: ABC transporter permease [Chloroflexota bacterium]